MENSLADSPLFVDFSSFIFSLSFFAVFVGVLVAIRIGRYPAAIRKMTRIHCGFAVIYLGVFYLFYGWSEQAIWQIVLGEYLFFSFFYAFFFFFIATISRGFSVGIMAWMADRGGRAQLSQIREQKDMKSDRIDVMAQMGIVTLSGQKARLTPRATLIIRLNGWIHRIWSLEYLK